MRRLLLLAVLLLTASCGASGPKLINTATYKRLDVQPFVTPVQVDLEIAPQKVSHSMMIKMAVAAGGVDNVIATAVKEALDANGDADVMVGLQYQLKYNAMGEMESITVTGLPAKYVNLRNAESLPPVQAEESNDENGRGGFLSFGKKK